MLLDDIYADAIARGALLSGLGLAWVIVLVRLVGLRSFSKMTNFDFVMTVAMGSLLAGAAQTGSWAELTQTMTAMASLFAIQFAVAFLRQRSDRLDGILQNMPVLLMKDGKVLHAALRRTRVTQDDLTAKLREANVLDISSVRAVILETTGDVSVLHGPTLDSAVMAGVDQTPDRPWRWSPPLSRASSDDPRG
ncbi:YetF domain-containing protein [Sulfitobacter sp. LCG007]